MGRQPCCDKIGLKRGPWTIEEDHRLITFILNNGIQCWRLVPKLAGLLRCGKSCRLRWINYLRPDLKRGAFSEMEENQMIELHARLGNRWSKIASHFPGRTDNEIKNHWNTKIKKRLKLQGINPLTHQPIQQNDAVKPNINIAQSDMKIIQNLRQEKAAKDTDHANESNEKMSKSWENLMISEETNPASNCYSPTAFSFGDSVSSYHQNQSTGESTASIHQEQYWVESVDSMMLWDAINHIDQYLLFSGLMQ